MSTAFDKALEAGREAVARQNMDEALAHFEKASSLRPDNPVVLGMIGQVLLAINRVPLAAIVLAKALEIDPNDGTNLHNIGNAYRMLKDPERAEEMWLRSTKIEDQADTWGNLSSLHINQGRPERAIAYALEALKRDPKQSTARWNLSLAHLERGDYARGWDYYESGFDSNLRHKRGYGDDIAQWNGEPGKRVIVYGEQGVGDEIMFASCLPDLIAISEAVFFDCHPRLVSMCERSFGIPCYGTRKKALVSWVDKEKPTHWVAIGSLPKFFRRSADAFPGTPFLKADAGKVARFRGDSTLPRIGIAWEGGTDKTNRDFRSMTLSEWDPIFGAVDAEWHSLHYDKQAPHQICAYGAKSGLMIRHDAEVVHADDMDDFHALIASMDLVISVDQTLVHQAGALGIQTWVLTPARASWRYPRNTQRMDWYNSARLFKQKEGETWEPVVQQIADALGRHFAKGVLHHAA